MRMAAVGLLALLVAGCEGQTLKDAVNGKARPRPLVMVDAEISADEFCGAKTTGTKHVGGSVLVQLPRTKQTAWIKVTDFDRLAEQCSHREVLPIKTIGDAK